MSVSIDIYKATKLPECGTKIDNMNVLIFRHELVILYVPLQSEICYILNV